MAWSKRFKKNRYRRRTWRSKRRRFGLRRRRYGGTVRRRVSGISRKLFRKGVFSSEIDYIRYIASGNIPFLGPTTRTGLIADLTALPEGDGYSERIGRKIFVRHLNIRLAFLTRPSGTPSTPWVTVHMMVVRDKSPPRS